MAWGQSLAAVRSGMAECTPNLRASYDAAETTPRSSRWPPTTTALPFSSGLNSSSTDTKKASISTWKIVLVKLLMDGDSRDSFYQDGGRVKVSGRCPYQDKFKEICIYEACWPSPTRYRL